MMNPGIGIATKQGMIMLLPVDKSEKPEMVGRICLQIFPECENEWQAVEQYRLLLRKEILRQENIGLTAWSARADYRDICEIADWWANRLAGEEINGGVIC